MNSRALTKNNLNHVFYFGRDNRCVQWSACESIEKSYWTAVLESIPSSYQIIVTENTKHLPRYGDKVIVFLKSDEFASDIEYSTRIKAVFRNYFDKKYSHDKNIFFLPLPYLGKINDISIIPILDRKIDVLFVGQAVYPERNELSKIILDLKSRKKDLKIIFQKTRKFFSGWNIYQYLKQLGDSKISLCPRGASTETYRHFESLRHGCVVISTPLSDAWYFKNSPIQIIQQWDELPPLLSNLVHDGNLLKEISKKSIEYWDSKLSPEAVARFIKSSLRSLE